ncbi:hypothetical protein L211DRAFT_852926 [Terfezia boudieri ATCC MYA-4762]|uniref:Uncharacterized protein n=1 Tax=Terfezia boudieri ATCC MYA-4762 TaxID=1051890 RepID=A0A3N4LAR1_9PEZI|nr:hypothetical protein L211DRAFT_852926 [Terfezia boudieri ATCC MYA-4762]
MSRHGNAPQRHDGAEGGPAQSSSLKYRHENLRPMRRKFLCDAQREADTQIIGRAPGPQILPTLLVRTPSERGKTCVLSAGSSCVIPTEKSTPKLLAEQQGPRHHINQEINKKVDASNQELKASFDEKLKLNVDLLMVQLSEIKAILREPG